MRSIIFVIILFAVSPSLASAQLKPSSTSPFTWREAQASEDSELDRLNRAFVQLADHARPAIVQIRVTTTQDAKGNPALILFRRFHAELDRGTVRFHHQRAVVFPTATPQPCLRRELRYRQPGHR